MSALRRGGRLCFGYFSFDSRKDQPSNPAKRIADGSEEKARPAYEKALRSFHRLRAFSELAERVGFEPTCPCGQLDFESSSL